MKKSVSMLIVLFVTLMIIGCQQRKEEKSQTNYPPAPAPTQMQIDQLQQAANMAPKNAQAWAQLGDALMDSQRFGEAIDAYDKALRLDPKDLNVMVDQGTCFRGVRKFDKAVEVYRKAIKIDPNFPNAHRNLAVVLSYDLHNKKEGIKEFQKYLELAPNAPDIEMIKQTINSLSAEK